MGDANRQGRVIANLEEVSVTYGTGPAAVHAVRSVSLDVRDGEVLLLMGPSGSGKSSLLQVLGCLRRPNAGRVLIDSRPVESLDEPSLSAVRRERIGFVFQHYNLIPSLRAWENVAMALELRGTPGGRIEDRSGEILFSLGVQRPDAFPAELSGGEKQRVAIARAIIGEPDLILADEPTAALDAGSGSQVAHLLSGIAHRMGKAVVVVTHDRRITGFADRIALLEDGKITSVRKNIDFGLPLRQERSA